MDDISVILRWGDGAIGVTGWGWLFFSMIAMLVSSSVTNYFKRD